MTEGALYPRSTSGVLLFLGTSWALQASISALSLFGRKTRFKRCLDLVFPIFAISSLAVDVMSQRLLGMTILGAKVLELRFIMRLSIVRTIVSTNGWIDWGVMILLMAVHGFLTNLIIANANIEE